MRVSYGTGFQQSIGAAKKNIPVTTGKAKLCPDTTRVNLPISYDIEVSYARTAMISKQETTQGIERSIRNRDGPSGNSGGFFTA